MNLIEVTTKFQTKEACLEYLADLRWPNGISCAKCGATGNDRFLKFTTRDTTRMRYSKKKRAVVEVKVPSRRLYECKGCGYPFSVTSGTVFNATHLPLERWFEAVAMILEAEQDVSALQVCRHLGVPVKNNKSVWYLCHRIREATRDTGLLTGQAGADRELEGRSPRRRPRNRKFIGDITLEMGRRSIEVHPLPANDAEMERVAV